MFLRDAYEAVIDKDTVVGSAITRVKAIAQNDGMGRLLQENSRKMAILEPATVHYFLGDTIFEYRGMSRPSDGLFTIDKSTGEIKLAKNLGLETLKLVFEMLFLGISPVVCSELW